jgi:hypothetical protein
MAIRDLPSFSRPQNFLEALDLPTDSLASVVIVDQELTPVANPLSVCGPIADRRTSPHTAVYRVLGGICAALLMLPGGLPSALAAPGTAPGFMSASAPAPSTSSPAASAATHRSAKSGSAPVADGPKWAALTPIQREALAPLEREWSTIDAPRKSKWMEIASRFPAMSVADRQRVQERMIAWARLSPVERTQARLSFQEAKQLSAQERQSRWEAYQALAPEQRNALASRASAPVSAATRPHAASAASAPGAAVATSAAMMAASGHRPQRPDPARNAVVKAVSPTLVQAKPGATTTLINQTASRPAHQTPGQPTIAARSGSVDPATLLPKSGPQATARPASAASSASAAR